MTKSVCVKLYLCLLFISTLFFPKNIYAVFIENFNGVFDNPLSWTVDNNLPGLTFTPTTLDLTANSSTKFPFVRSSTQIIDSSDDFIEYKFKYVNAGTGFGNGIAVTDFVPPLNTVMFYPATFSQYSMFYSWQGGGSPFFHIVTFLCPASDLLCIPGTPTIIYQTISSDTSDHVIRIVKSGFTYSLYLDDINLFTSASTTRQASNVWIGHPETTNTSGSWASLSIDYVKTGVLSSPSPSPTIAPSPSPSPTPTTTPTPIPAFPYLSQLDPAWKDIEYNEASDWAALDKYGIGRWGCALTSATMVLKNYGVKALDGSDLDPAKLNAWLNTQRDGYVGLGYLNWLAITRYVRRSYDLGHSPTKLEYVRSYLPTTPVLPVVLGLPGHFVVAHGEDALNWLINDPANATNTQLAKTSTVNSVNRYVPSLTDLSYMMFVADPELQIYLLNKNNQVIPIDWSSESLVDDIDSTEGPTNRVGIVPKLPGGKYSIRVTNPSDEKRNIEFYMYDKSGNVASRLMKVGKDSDLKFEMKFNSDKAKKSKIEHKKKYRYEWNKKRKWWNKIWDEHDRWEERKHDDHDERDDD